MEKCSHYFKFVKKFYQKSWMFTRYVPTTSKNLNSKFEMSSEKQKRQSMKAPAIKAEEVELPMCASVLRSAASIRRADRRRRTKLKNAEQSVAQSLGDLSQGRSSARPPHGLSPSSPNYFNDPSLPAFQPSRFFSLPDEANESRGIDLNQDAHFSRRRGRSANAVVR